MKRNLIMAVTAILVVSLIPLGAVWAAGPTEPAETRYESPVLEKLELGDGTYMPRFIGERTALEPEPERMVLAVEDREASLRVQIQTEIPVEMIYASKK